MNERGIAIEDAMEIKVVGKSGQISAKIGKKTVKVRTFSLDFQFKEAHFLDQGLSTSGLIIITWVN